jgi:two-component system, chemotaxis family, protein-glutamate methylesterase/glutaminase
LNGWLFKMTVKVLIVDDSAVVRQVLTEQLASIAGIEVMGAARDPLFARKLMEKQWPDVIVLDIEMPRMDGLTFLRQLMGERPTPVIICSTLTEQGAEITMQAMSAGAVDIIAKPKIGLRQFLEDSKTLLGDAIKAAGHARMDHVSAGSRAKPVMAPTQKLPADAVLAERAAPIAGMTERVVAIGTSTGGTQALEYVLTRLPRTAPGIVIVQHMPETVHGRLCRAARSALSDRGPRGAQRRPRHPRTGPDRARHAIICCCAAAVLSIRVEVMGGPLVSRIVPRSTCSFARWPSAAGPNAVGIIMTGMGDDGARGLLEMHQAGALTIARTSRPASSTACPRKRSSSAGWMPWSGCRASPNSSPRPRRAWPTSVCMGRPCPDDRLSRQTLK